MNTQAQSSGQNLSGPWLTTTIPILVTIIPQRTTTLSTIIHGSTMVHDHQPNISDIELATNTNTSLRRLTTFYDRSRFKSSS